MSRSGCLVDVDPCRRRAGSCSCWAPSCCLEQCYPSQRILPLEPCDCNKSRRGLYTMPASLSNRCLLKLEASSVCVHKGNWLVAIATRGSSFITMVFNRMSPRIFLGCTITYAKTQMKQSPTVRPMCLVWMVCYAAMTQFCAA